MSSGRWSETNLMEHLARERTREMGKKAVDWLCKKRVGGVGMKSKVTRDTSPPLNNISIKIKGSKT